MNDESKTRTYSEEELAVILRRALEFQDTPTKGELPTRSEGFSLQEIQAIAREVGLQPETVARAAATITRQAPGDRSWGLGGATAYELEYTAGREVTPEEFAEIVDLIRKATGRHGEVEEVLGALEWQTKSDLSSINVTVRPTGGRTNVRIASQQKYEALLTYLLSGGGWFILMGIAGGILDVTTVAETVALVSGSAGGAYITARTIWRAKAKKLKEQLTGLMRGLTGVLERFPSSPHDSGDSEGPESQLPA